MSGPPLVPVEGGMPPRSGYLEDMIGCFDEVYAAGADVWSDEPAMRVATEVLLSRLRPGSDVLDVGAGRGIDAARMGAEGHRVTAVDIVDVFESAAQPRPSAPVQFRHGRVQDLSSAAVFDAALDNGCLHHQHPDEAGEHLVAIARRLRPHGLVVLSLFDRTRGRRVDRRTPRGRLNRELDFGQVAELLRAAGLALVSEQLVLRQDEGRGYRIVVARRSAGGQA